MTPRGSVPQSLVREMYVVGIIEDVQQGNLGAMIAKGLGHEKSNKMWQGVDTVKEL